MSWEIYEISAKLEFGKKPNLFPYSSFSFFFLLNMSRELLSNWPQDKYSVTNQPAISERAWGDDGIERKQKPEEPQLCR